MSYKAKQLCIWSATHTSWKQVGRRLKPSFSPTLPRYKLSVILKASQSFELHIFELKMQSMKMDEELGDSGEGEREGKNPFHINLGLLCQQFCFFDKF